MPLRRSQYWRRPSTPVSTAIDGLSLTTEQATPEQIGLYLPTTRSVGAGSVSVRYRTTAGPGAWSTGHPLLRISTTGNEAGPTTLVDAFAGSIFDLTAGTQYDVELTHVESGQSTKVSTIQRTTRSLPAAAGAPNVTATTSDSLQTKFDALVAGDVLQLAAGTYTVSALTLSDSGTSGSPIYIRGVSRTGVIIKDTTGTVLSIAASHVILENLTIEGSSSDSDTAASSLGIGFSGAQTNVTVRNIDMVGVDRAINADGAQTGVLVYGCNLTGNNLWTSAFVDDNSTWNDDGVRLPGFGNCAWNNTLYGFGDAFAVIAGERSEGIYFYRNRVEMTGDDAFEGDYATRNVAFYDNIITNCGTLLSLDPLYGGPLYCFRNTAINTIRGPYKLNTDQTGFLIYNNTVVRTDGSSLGGDGQFTSSITMSNYSKRNNLLIYRGVNRALTSNNAHSAPLDNGYNAWYPNGGFAYFAESVDVANLAALQSALSSRTPLFGSTQRHVNDVITVTDPFAADITLGADHLTEYTGHTNVALTAGTSPKNAGIAIPGITDGFSGAAPDIGASIEGRAAITVGAWAPPYSVPTTVNTSTQIAQNSVQDVRPSVYDFDPPRWISAVFSVFSGPIFSPKYSDGGAMVFFNTGGHGGPNNIDLVAFDVSDGLWKRAQNAHGLASNSGDYGVGDTSGSPYYEVSAASPSGMPSSPHCYTARVYTEDGPKGSIYQVAAAGVTASSLLTGAAHGADLSTRVWFRAATGQISRGGSFEHSNAYDPVARRIYHFPHGPTTSFSFMEYLRLSDGTLQQTATYSNTGSQSWGSTYTRGFIFPSRRLLMHHAGGAGSLAALDITSDSTIANGWRVLTTTGATLPDSMNWVEHTVKGRMYGCEEQPSNTLYELTPPAGDLMTGTWTVAAITIGGAGLSNQSATYPYGNSHYRRLDYVPALEMLLWVADEDTAQLIKV